MNAWDPPQNSAATDIDPAGAAVQRSNSNNTVMLPLAAMKAAVKEGAVFFRKIKVPSVIEYLRLGYSRESSIISATGAATSFLIQWAEFVYKVRSIVPDEMHTLEESRVIAIDGKSTTVITPASTEKVLQMNAKDMLEQQTHLSEISGTELPVFDVDSTVAPLTAVFSGDEKSAQSVASSGSGMISGSERFGGWLGGRIRELTAECCMGNRGDAADSFFRSDRQKRTYQQDDVHTSRKVSNIQDYQQVQYKRPKHELDQDI
jgi:hypothetical protein